MSLENPQDGYVQVAADGSGKKIDNAELLRDDGTAIYRQRIVLGSDENPRQQVRVSGEAGRGVLYVESLSLDEVNERLDKIIALLTLIIE